MLKTFSIFSLFLASFALMTQAAHAEWSSADRTGYKARCEEGMKEMGPQNAKNFCNCATEKLESIYASPQAMGKKMQANPEAEKARFGPLVMQCARQHSGPPPQSGQN